MRRRTLLTVGLIAVAASVIGPGIGTSITSSPARPQWYAFGHDHMSWWPNGPTPERRIDGARELVGVATDLAFSPPEATVEVGEPVNLTLNNGRAVPHDLVIPALGRRVAADPGVRATIGIVANEARSFEVLCTFPGHAAAGMSGVLTVLPNR